MSCMLGEVLQRPRASVLVLVLVPVPAPEPVPCEQHVHSVHAKEDANGKTAPSRAMPIVGSSISPTKAKAVWTSARYASKMQFE